MCRWYHWCWCMFWLHIVGMWQVAFWFAAVLVTTHKIYYNLLWLYSHKDIPSFMWKFHFKVTFFSLNVASCTNTLNRARILEWGVLSFLIFVFLPPSPTPLMLSLKHWSWISKYHVSLHYPEIWRWWQAGRAPALNDKTKQKQWLMYAFWPVLKVKNDCISYSRDFNLIKKQ